MCFTQQAEALKLHTDLQVGMYWGAMGVDFWDSSTWKQQVDKYEVSFPYFGQLHSHLFFPAEVLWGCIPLWSVTILAVSDIDMSFAILNLCFLLFWRYSAERHYYCFMSALDAHPYRPKFSTCLELSSVHSVFFSLGFISAGSGDDPCHFARRIEA